jgi:hypothetical protein
MKYTEPRHTEKRPPMPRVKRPGDAPMTPQPSERPGNKSGGEEHGYGPVPAGPKRRK